MPPMWNAIFDNIFVVSLPSSEDRRSYIAKHLRDMGISKFEWHDAIDADSAEVKQQYKSGHVLTYPPCFRCGELKCSVADCNNILLPVQVAVVLTYRALFRKILASGQRALVIEDDARFHPHSHATLAFLAQKISKSEVPFRLNEACLLRLGWAHSKDHLNASDLRIDSAIRMSNPCFGITPLFAKYALERSQNIKTTADIFLHRDLPAENMAFTVYPPIASELSWSTGEFESLIHPKENRVNFLRSLGDAAGAELAATKLSRHIKHMHHRRFLITGHPRTGTGYSAGLLRQLGFDIGHECSGEDGLSSWMFAVDAEVYPFSGDHLSSTRRHLAWDYLLHVVRDPVTAIPSIIRDSNWSNQSYNFRRAHILASNGIDLDQYESVFERAVVSLMQWTRIIQDLRPDCWFRLEDGHEALLRFMKTNGLLPIEMELELDTSPVNADKLYQGVKREAPQITEADWALLTPETMVDLRAYCDRYGYNVPKGIPNNSFSSDEDHGITPTGLFTQFLEPSGWKRSALEQRPVRADGRPLPWFTFGAIEFLHQVVDGGMKVFEFGAGYSTLWWCRAATIDSVDHDPHWLAEIKPLVSSNVRLRLVEKHAQTNHAAQLVYEEFNLLTRRKSWPYDNNKVDRRGLNDEDFIGYAASVMDAEHDYDIIVIDGMARRLCTQFAVSKLKKTGFIVFDNSNRSDYDVAYQILKQHGFYQLPFWGLVPGANFMTCTSIFLRTLDMLPNGLHHPNSFNLPEF